MRVACQIGHQNLGNGKNPYGRCCGTQGFLGATYMPVTAKRAYSAHAGCATLSLGNGTFGANTLFRARTRAVQNLPRQTRAAIPPPCGCAGRWTANPKAPLLHQPFRFFWQPLIYMGTAKKKRTYQRVDGQGGRDHGARNRFLHLYQKTVFFRWSVKKLCRCAACASAKTTAPLETNRKKDKKHLSIATYSCVENVVSQGVPEKAICKTNLSFLAPSHKTSKKTTALSDNHFPVAGAVRVLLCASPFPCPGANNLLRQTKRVGGYLHHAIGCNGEPSWRASEIAKKDHTNNP